MTFSRHQLKILRNIDSHMSHVDTSNKVLTTIPKHLNYLCSVAHPSLRKLPPAQEKYNFAIVTEHCCEVEAAEFEANLKKLDFIENYEVK